MATVSAKIYEHHKKADGTYNVKICVYHKGKRKYIDTTHFVVKKQLTKDFKIKDPFVADKVEQQLRDYRKVISGLEGKLDYFSAEALRDYLRDKDEDIDFINFCDTHIARLRSESRTKTAENQNVVRNSLVDYFNRASVSINEIHYNMLVEYERFLKTKRILTRLNQFGQPITITVDGVKDATVHNYMRDLRTLFNAARYQFNNEDIGICRINHYPFKKYKVGSPPLTKKRNHSPEQVLAIRDCTTKPGSRAELAKELYMLSFYLCGINAIDLYQLRREDIRNGRADYNRSKTKGKRKDKALSKGMEEICKLTGIPEAIFYWARHTFANTARNDCRMSKDDVALALNHVDEGNRTTDIYIAKDWKIVDDVQSKVMEKLKEIEVKSMTKHDKKGRIVSVAA